MDYLHRPFSPSILFLSFILACTHTSSSQNLIKNFPSTDGFVSAIVSSGDTVFIGGTFQQVGPSAGNVVKLDTSAGIVDTSFPVFTGPNLIGEVNAVASDGSGGWYVGGYFTYVAGSSRKYFAHINSDMTVDKNWTIYPDGPVFTILVNGSTVYLGGAFKNIILTPTTHSRRWRLAALDASRNTLLSWNPETNGNVLAMALSGSNLIAGGSFTLANLHIDTVARNNIVAFDTSTGIATPWNPNANGQVNAIVASGSVIYAGGSFTTIGDSTRNYITAIDSSTGLATDWNANANNSVMTLALHDSLLYAGGTFGTIGGASRQRLASVDTVTGAATGWNPTVDAIVNSLSISNNVIYFGGWFTHVGGIVRNHLAAMDLTTGSLKSWNPNNPSNTDTVLAVAASGSAALAGGIFITVNPATRNNIAAFNATTGALLSWNPSIDGSVFAMALSGQTLYVGGAFGKIGSIGRTNAGAINISTATATSWNPVVDGQVNSIALSNSVAYMGGNFTWISNSVNARHYLGGASLSGSGGVTGWDPVANASVTQLILVGSTVYAGGFFTTVGGQTRNHIAAIKTGGGVTSWDPNANNEVEALAMDGSTLYAGGQFTTMGGVSRKHIAALDTSTGLATSWDPSANSIVDALASSGSTIYAGGLFTSIGSAGRNFVAALDTSTGLATSWNPNADAAVQVIGLDHTNQQIYLGGSFAVMDDYGNQTFAAVTNPSDTVLPVELVSFSAVATGLSTTLKWTTATEVNNHGFEVQRTATSGQEGAESWLDVAFMRGAGSSASPRQYSYVDRHLTAGRYVYRIKQIDNNGQTKLTSTVQVDVGQAPREFTLSQNYPNPFNPATTIEFTLPADGRVVLKVYDILGREVETLVDGNRQAGSYQLAVFDASRFSSGIYFARLESAGKHLMRKMLLLK